MFSSNTLVFTPPSNNRPPRSRRTHHLCDTIISPPFKCVLVPVESLLITHVNPLSCRITTSLNQLLGHNDAVYLIFTGAYKHWWFHCQVPIFQHLQPYLGRLQSSPFHLIPLTTPPTNPLHPAPLRSFAPLPLPSQLCTTATTLATLHHCHYLR